jgi:folate-binding Fe-S cluster repair protein YgfZ
VTNDVVTLTAGAGQRAAALTPKGRVIALCRIFDRGTDLAGGLRCRRGVRAFAAMIRKFVNPRLAKYALVTRVPPIASAYMATTRRGRWARALGGDDAMRDAIEALAPLAGRWIGAGDEAAWVGAIG